VEQAAQELGLATMGSDEAEAVVAAVVAERAHFVKEKGMAAVGPLMGPVMERLRGKVDGKSASEMLKREIARFLKG
jgi:glutamyl-tRNA(Gln) amidotransferase subunit E